MGIFRSPEIATRFGALADEAFTDGAPASAHVLRELARNANLLATRGGLLYRYVGDADTASELEGAALSHAPPFWQHMIPAPAVPVPKKFGVTSIRVRYRLVITNGLKVELGIGTIATPNPYQRLASVALATGTGALQVVDMNASVREARDELLSFWMRAWVDPDNDPLMVTGTYGTQNTGVVDSNTEFSFTDTGSAWNASGSSQVHIGGHYVTFTDAAGNTPVHGPCEVRGVMSSTELAIYPPVGNRQFLRGSTFTIRKLPSVRVVSIAAYGFDREAA